MLIYSVFMKAYAGMRKFVKKCYLCITLSEKPMVSVIIPNYCHAPYLARRIESVLGQSYRDIEVIVLDDCSTDGSREVIERYRTDPRVTHVVYNEVNSGSPFVQWRRGFELARGKYIWIAESDDFSHPAFLERCVEQLEAHPECVAAHTLSRFVDSDGRPLGKEPAVRKRPPRVVEGPRLIVHGLLMVNEIYNASMVVFRRDALPPDGNYSRYRYCGDWLFWMEMAFGGSVCTIFEPLNYFRRHDTTTTGRSERSGGKWLEVLPILNYVFGMIPVPASLRWAIVGKSYYRMWRMGCRLEWPYGYRKAWNCWTEQWRHPWLLMAWYKFHKLLPAFTGL